MPHLRIVTDNPTTEPNSITEVLEEILELSRKDQIKHLVVGVMDTNDELRFSARSLTLPRSAVVTVGMCETLRHLMTEELIHGQ